MKNKELKYNITDCVPYQLCPKCNGTKTIKKYNYTINSNCGIISDIQCDICNAVGIIPMYVIKENKQNYGMGIQQMFISNETSSSTSTQ
jgi:hypothetical protein